MASPSNMENRFTEELFKIKYAGKCYNLFGKAEYSKMLQDVKTAAVSKESKNQHDYHILRKYEVLQCGPVEKLIKKREHAEETPMYFVTIEETFDVLRASHIATGHGGRDRMMKEIKKKYANISVQAIELFKSLCLECQKKRTRPKTTGVVVRPILTKDFSCRGQVDLVDMQSMSCNGYKWIMVYQDHLTKFCVLRAIRSKRPTEVASQLLDIFLLLGAPVILQSDNGTEFTANVISELMEFWPSLKMVHGKPHYPQSQGSVERANCDIKDMLVAWLADNNSQDWVAGIKFVQFHKNSAYHSGIKRSPYSALFGNEARVGLTSSTLPREILDNLESEDDLARLDLPQPASRAASSVVADNSTADANLTSAEPSASADATLTSAEPSALSPDTTLTSAEPSASADATLISADPTTTTADPLQTSDASMLTAHVERVTRVRKEAFSGQLSQAERMTALHERCEA
ncbi:KRAB-A domain-containing protein 2-like [Littorina saxatilis]|uniref:KRAB-A domain-containing protein 2-like n=1 Tax=Littorina saxatilis TaxID=31220 RepID=UPI0038B598E0